MRKVNIPIIMFLTGTDFFFWSTLSPGNITLFTYTLFISLLLITQLMPRTLYADTLSMANLSCGIASIFIANNGYLVWAIIFILAGQIFDWFDGLVAKKCGGTRAGPYLDDVADFVSFGIATGNIIRLSGDSYAAVFGYYFAISIAFRLLRFLIFDKKKKDLPSGIFNGLPSPAGALIVLGATLVFNPFWIYISTLISIGLMISHIRFAHFGRVIIRRISKKKLFISMSIATVILVYIAQIRSNALFGYFIISAVILYMLVGRKMALDMDIAMPPLFRIDLDEPSTQTV